MGRPLKAMTAVSAGLVNNPQQHIPQILTNTIDYDSLARLKFDVLSDQTVALNHAKATEYCDLPIFKGEREVTDQHVLTLYDEMCKGTFNPLLVILSTALYQNAVYKINGQHTAWAVLYMPPSYSLQVREIRYKVNSREQLKLLYSTYDRIKARSDAHVAKVYLADTAVSEGLWVRLLSQLSSAAKFWLVTNDNARRRMSPEQLAALIQKDCPIAFRTAGIVLQDNYQAGRDIIGRVPVLAAIMATAAKLPSRVNEFWGPVADGLTLTSKTDPRWMLREQLQSLRVKATARSDKRYMSQEDVYRICILAWNKWRKGETVKVSLRPPQDRVKPG